MDFYTVYRYIFRSLGVFFCTMSAHALDVTFTKIIDTNTPVPGYPQAQFRRLFGPFIEGHALYVYGQADHLDAQCKLNACAGDGVQGCRADGNGPDEAVGGDVFTQALRNPE